MHQSHAKMHLHSNSIIASHTRLGHVMKIWIKSTEIVGDMFWKIAVLEILKTTLKKKTKQKLPKMYIKSIKTAESSFFLSFRQGTWIPT